MVAAYFAILAVACLVALSNWRAGLALMIVVGVLADPVRKVMPGAPGLMALAFAPVWLAICVRVFLSSGRPVAAFLSRYPRLQPRLSFFLFALGLAFAVLLLKHGFVNFFVGVIGGIGYVFPLIAMLVGFHFVRSKSDLDRLLKAYVLFTAPFLVGGLLEYYKVFPDSLLIGTAALGTEWIRHVPGYIVELNAGFYRSPDVMGWHAALLVMFSLLLFLGSRRAVGRFSWAALAIWGGIILLISGRNKMIFMPLIFMSVYGLAYLFKGRLARTLSLGIASAVAVGFFVVLSNEVELEREYVMYVQQGTVEAPDRLAAHGIDEVRVTYWQSGFFGEGLGAASTGSRYGGKTGIRGWQEGGLSKILVELGVVGFVAVFVLLGSIASLMYRLFQSLPANSPVLPYFVGLLGVLAANGASFIVSHQIFGDPLIVTLAGFFLGVAFSFVRWRPQTGPVGARR